MLILFQNSLKDKYKTIEFVSEGHAKNREMTGKKTNSLTQYEIPQLLCLVWFGCAGPEFGDLVMGYPIFQGFFLYLKED